MDKHNQLGESENQSIANDFIDEEEYLSPNKILGNNYEAYIGNLLESQGFSVIYTGFKFGYYDNHVDLIAFNKERIVFVQCKFHSTALRFQVIRDLVSSKETYKRLINNGFGIHWSDPTNVLNQFGSIEFRLYCRYKQSKDFEDYAKKNNVEVVVENINASYEKTYDDSDSRYLPIPVDKSAYSRSRKEKMEREMQKYLFNELSNVISYIPPKEKVPLAKRVGCYMTGLFIIGFCVYGIYSIIYLITSIIQRFNH